MRPDQACIYLPPITGHRRAKVNRAASISPATNASARRVEIASANHWTQFWREFGPEDLPQDRCFVPPAGRLAVDRHWANFADMLPQGARAIDLGCGTGIVGRQLTDRQSHVRVVGVDWADMQAPVSHGVDLHMGVRMEALPFADNSFDAAASLFGIEYGEIDKIAPELARVLRSGARFSFLIHHRESETLREGTARRRELQALLAGKLKRAFLASSASGVIQFQSRLETEFPAGTMAALIGAHCLRNINRGRSDREAIWADVEANLAPEVALLGHLEQSAKSAAELASWLGSLVAVMQLASVSVLSTDAGEPVAWIVCGRR